MSQDINGVREVELLLPLISLVQQLLRPSVLAVKSRRLAQSITAMDTAELGKCGGSVAGVTNPLWWTGLWSTMPARGAPTGASERVPPACEYSGSADWLWRPTVRTGPPTDS